jgi:arylsulfatase A-like enzyme
MKKTNVLWIMCDQLRGQALSCMGDPNVSTPNIDRLAGTGVSFTSAVAGFPLCCPFRGSMLTSRYPHTCVPGHELQMPPKQKTIADVFNEEGYDTCYMGKWHLDGFKEKEGRAAMHIVPPDHRGRFKKWMGYENNNSQWDSWVHGGEAESAFHERLDGYETDVLTDRMLEYLDEKERDREPFFAVLSVQPPHDPYLAPPEFMDRHNPAKVVLRENVPNIPWITQRARKDLAGYYAMIENLDWNIGRIIDRLMDSGMYYNTHILFFSDHGDSHGSHGHFKKTNPYQESVGIPFIISGEKPMRYDGRGCADIPNVPVNHVDIAPTTLGLCGIKVPDWMAGTDYSSYRLMNRPPANAPRSAYMQNILCTPYWDCIDHQWRGIVTVDDWKYVCLENMPWMMFHLNEDPYEQVNLVFNTRYREKQRTLQQELKAWIDKTGDQFLLPEI